MSAIYALCDPETREVRYIGMTAQSPSKRLEQHVRNARYGLNTHVSHWLSSISFAPKVVILEDGPVDIREAERVWIALGRALGWRLTNLTDGGEGILGYTHSTETRKRMADSHRGVSRAPFTESHRARLSAAATRWKRPARDTFCECGAGPFCGRPGLATHLTHSARHA